MILLVSCLLTQIESPHVPPFLSQSLRAWPSDAHTLPVTHISQSDHSFPSPQAKWSFLSAPAIFAHFY